MVCPRARAGSRWAWDAISYQHFLGGSKPYRRSAFEISYWFVTERIQFTMHANVVT